MLFDKRVKVLLEVRISVLLQLLQHLELFDHLQALFLQRSLHFGGVLAVLPTHFLLLGFVWVDLLFLEQLLGLLDLGLLVFFRHVQLMLLFAHVTGSADNSSRRVQYSIGRILDETAGAGDWLEEKADNAFADSFDHALGSTLLCAAVRINNDASHPVVQVTTERPRPIVHPTDRILRVLLLVHALVRYARGVASRRAETLTRPLHGVLDDALAVAGVGVGLLDGLHLDERVED